MFTITAGKVYTFYVVSEKQVQFNAVHTTAGCTCSWY